MKREDRVARLEALLARVKANAAARGERPRSVLSYPPEPIAEEEDEGQPPLPILVVPRAPLADESTLQALSQRALALTTSDALAAAPTATGEDAWPVSVSPPSAPEAVAVAHDPVPDEPAPSHLERAVRDAAAEQLSPLLREAAAELRDHERRPMSEPPPPDDEEAQGLENAFFAAAELEPAALAPEPAMLPESTRPPPSRQPTSAPLVAAQPDRGNTMLWFGAAAGATLVLAATWLFQRKPDAPIREPPAREVAAESTPLPARTQERGAGPSAKVDPSPAPTSAPALSVTQPPIADPPDTSVLARDKGFLWVETTTPREVFVNGHTAGPSGRWLQVGCGLRNVRSAQPGPPPAGASFPIWTSEGHSVLIPCRSYTRVTLPTDP